MMTKTEQIRIALELDGKAARTHKADARQIAGYTPHVGEDDTFKLTYTFRCEYFGEVEAKLAAIARILDDESVIRTADIYELEYGRSLLVGIVSRINEITAKLGGGK